MNLCAFSRQSGYMKHLTHKVGQQPRLEEILANFYLPIAKLEFDSHDNSNDWLSVGITSAQGWRTHQEDSDIADLHFDQNDQFSLFGVFDGHNGCEVAQYAAKMLPEYLKNNENFQNRQYIRGLEQSFLAFDASLLEERNNNELSNIRYQYEVNNAGVKRKNQSPLVALNTGCTAIVALLHKSGQFYVANIGDSRCVLCVKGKIVPMSKDHKPTDLAEKRRIERAGYSVINGRINHGLNLSRAFGDHALKNKNLSACEQAVSAFPDVAVCKERIRAGDFMILACDGIWNSMSTSRICSLVRKNIKKGLRLSQICELIVRRCVSPVRPLNGQIGGDNMTVVIVRFDRPID